MDGGGGTLDSLRGAIGLDSLQVQQDAEGNAQVAIGKQVAEGVWVRSKRSLGEGSNSIEVEIELTDDIVVDTEMIEDGSAWVGFEWKKDF